jgi:outer membrane murein-binding lipoprotein Lpp
MKFFTKIVFFIILLAGCSSSGLRVGKTPKEVYQINHRADLQRLQRDRQARAREAKKAAEKEARQQQKAMKAVKKQKKQEEKLLKRALKEGAKRHQDWQSAETRKRMNENKKKSQKQMNN